MPREIRIANLPDGRTVQYDPYSVESGAIITEAFYLDRPFTDADLRIWVKNHKYMKSRVFPFGAVIIGERLIDEHELINLLPDCVSPKDQFFDQALQIALES